MALKSTLVPFTEGPQVVGARLCHFGSASSELLQSHKHWITQYFLPVMKKQPGAWIDFYGYASRTGGAPSNLALSQLRINATEEYFKTQYPGIKVNIRLAKGYQESASFRDPESSNDGYWRAVLIRWFGISLNIPTPVYPPNRFASPLMYRVYRLLPMAEIWRAAAERVLSAALRALNATSRVMMTRLLWRWSTDVSRYRKKVEPPPR